MGMDIIVSTWTWTCTFTCAHIHRTRFTFHARMTRLHIYTATGYIMYNYIAHVGAAMQHT